METTPTHAVTHMGMIFLLCRWLNRPHGSLWVISAALPRRDLHPVGSLPPARGDEVSVAQKRELMSSSIEWRKGRPELYDYKHGKNGDDDYSSRNTHSGCYVSVNLLLCCPLQYLFLYCFVDSKWTTISLNVISVYFSSFVVNYRPLSCLPKYYFLVWLLSW